MALAADPKPSKALESVLASGQMNKIVRDFTRLLFQGVDEAELAAVKPRSLAQIAEAAFDAIRVRAPDHAVTRIYDPAGDFAHGAVTVIDIINDDMPFLLDSVLAELKERGLTIRLVAHPLLYVRRDARGELTGLTGNGDADPRRGAPESIIHIHTGQIESEAARQALTAKLESILVKVRAVVQDWRPMLERLDRCIAAYANFPPPVAPEVLAESIEFLKWLADKNFTFLGMRAYAFTGEGESGELRPIPDSGLGLLRDPDVTVLRRGGALVRLTAGTRGLFMAPEPLIIAKANSISEVHRRAHMDSIGIKLYSEKGELRGELRVAGLFTTSAYSGSTRNTPFLRLKVDQVLRLSGHAPQSHSGKALFNVLETYPREELFQIAAGQLLEFATGIVYLELNPRTRVFARKDEFGRFMSVLVYVARERFSTDIRKRINAFLAGTYGGYLASFTPFFPEGPTVRLHIIIWRDEGDIPDREQAFLEAEVEKIVRSWKEELKDRARLYYGDRAAPLTGKYLDAFPAGYQETNRPSRALEDIQRLEQLTPESPIAIDFFRDATGPAYKLRAALYQLDEPISLSRRVPIIEHLGFKVIAERTSQLSPLTGGGPRTIYLHDLLLETSDQTAISAMHADRLEPTFLAIWQGRAADDRYNGLALRAALNWREAALLRAYGAYLRQIVAPFGQGYMGSTLNRHGAVVGDLLTLFHTLFDPGYGLTPERRRQDADKIAAKIEAKLEKVPSLEEDRVLRRFLNLIRATLRTNFYQRGPDGGYPETIAFKFDCAKVEGLPPPKPFAEIFVYSPRFEGVHLRFGRIARGGLRWSDRPQDFRTEVLGLVKAQQVKNVVIVPQGAKGGFVPKRLPADGSREARQSEGVACYKSFIKTLLSVTDNLNSGQVAPPPLTVRFDGDDPYLVVAADKGTATFSDIANAIAIEHHFWLGDAFASGGSAGYDHKEMAITARGGWEAVKRHFREKNFDIQTTPFRVIGVGDMSGDVFGNGMLLSRQIKLIAAFDHRDIFIDPDPDPETSWEERKRIFDLPRSSWRDYNPDRISKGGGVFSRGAKFLDLSPEIKSLFGLAGQITPNDLAHAVLKAEADLLWLGGIGTFVKASGETDEEAGDRANDALRVKAAELRVKAVGEGANLGMTQKARIEFALDGGRGNTDAIDNSAGVNSSDIEVNIKIALGAAVSSGKINLDERNAILKQMTGEVAEACLRNNYLQTLAISLGERRGFADLGFQSRLMHALELRGLLNRELEALPSDGELAERRHRAQPLTRPELAVLLAFAKIALYHDLVESAVPDDPYLSKALSEYFPPLMRERFAPEVSAHQLRREIIATMITNEIINRGGSTFIVRLTEETGHEPASIAYAFETANAVFDAESLYAEIDALDNRIDGQRQLDLYMLLQDVLRQQTSWFLRHGRFERGLTEEIERYRSGIGRLWSSLDDLLEEQQRHHLMAARAGLIEDGVPAPLATKLAALAPLSDGPDIVLAAQAAGRPETEVAKVYFEAGNYFRLAELRAASDRLAQADYFDRLAVDSSLNAVAAAQRALVRNIVLQCGGAAPDFGVWRESHGQAVSRARRSLDEILGGGELTLAKLTVAVAHMRDAASH